MESIINMALTIRDGEQTISEPCEIGFTLESGFDPYIDYIFGLCSGVEYDRARVVESDEMIISRILSKGEHYEQV